MDKHLHRRESAHDCSSSLFYSFGGNHFYFCILPTKKRCYRVFIKGLFSI